LICISEWLIDHKKSGIHVLILLIEIKKYRDSGTSMKLNLFPRFGAALIQGRWWMQPLGVPHQLLQILPQAYSGHKSIKCLCQLILPASVHILWYGWAFVRNILGR